MITKKVTRHYCEFCRNGMFFKGRMEKHERGCTRNPNRVCGVCVMMKNKQTPLPELLKCLDGITDENSTEKMGALRALCNNCPACLLATVRKHPSTSFENVEFEDQSSIVDTGFDFKKEMKAWWDEQNNIAAMRDIQNY